MAEINAKLHMARAYGHAMAMLEARKKIAEATAQEESAEAELKRMGLSLYDATQSADRRRYFECDGDPEIRVRYADAPGAPGKCPNVVGVHGWDEPATVGLHLCPDCDEAHKRAADDAKGHPEPGVRTTAATERAAAGLDEDQPF